MLKITGTKRFLSPKTAAQALGILVGAATFIVFLSALRNDFVNWDDDVFILNNRHILSMNLDFLKWIFFNREVQWSPMRWFSHAVDYQLWGLAPSGHHLTSVILHSLNAFLVTVVTVKLVEIAAAHTNLQSGPLPTETPVYRRRACIAGIVTGILFGIHPLRVESVVWISERKDVLYAFFSLLSLLFYLAYSMHAPGKKKLSFALSLLCFLMSVMSKAMAVTLPFVFLILDVYPLKRITLRNAFGSERRVLAEKLPFFGLSIVAALINMSIHEEMGAIAAPLINLTLISRLQIAFKNIAAYLLKIVWPVNLAPLYPFPTDASFFRPDYLGSFLLVLSVTLSSLYLWKKGNKVLFLVWAYFIVTILPVLGIVRLGAHFASDRYTYMPSIGPFLLIGLGIASLYEKDSPPGSMYPLLKKIAIAVFVGVTILLCTLTIRQTGIWKNSIVLWSREIEIYPFNALANAQLGSARTEAGDYHNAENDLNRAIQYDPLNKVAYKLRGNLYVILKQYDRALRDFDKTIELDPEFSEGYGNRCGVQIELGNLKQAAEDCSRAIELNAQNATAYNNRGLARVALGDLEAAVADYSRAIALSPGDSGFYRNRGMVYLRMKRNNEGIKDLKEAAQHGDAKTQETLRKFGIRW
jgi:Flp pilus assembly protein TadD